MWALKALAAAAALLLGSSSGATVLEEFEPQDCISLTRLNYTHVLDDRRVLFYMKNKDIYLNNLPNSCPLLGSEKRFLYKVTMNQLCRMDTVTVLSNFGFGFMEGATCPLGAFLPVTAAEAKILRKNAKRRR